MEIGNIEIEKVPKTRKLKMKKAIIVNKKPEKSQNVKMKENKCKNCGHVEIEIEQPKEKKEKKEDSQCKLCGASYKNMKDHSKDEKHMKCKEFLQDIVKMNLEQINKLIEAKEKIN